MATKCDISGKLCNFYREIGYWYAHLSKELLNHAFVMQLCYIIDSLIPHVCVCVCALYCNIHLHIPQ